jgi:hypothetical protein
MSIKRISSLTAALAFFGMVGCGGADREFEQTEQEIFTQPATETVEVEVMTEDTFLVERTVETRVDVDTTRVDGADVPPTTTTTPGTAPRTGTGN